MFQIFNALLSCFFYVEKTVCDVLKLDFRLEQKKLGLDWIKINVGHISL